MNLHFFVPLIFSGKQDSSFVWELGALLFIWFNSLPMDLTNAIRILGVCLFLKVKYDRVPLRKKSVCAITENECGTLISGFVLSS